MTLPGWLLHAIADQTGDHTAGTAHPARLLECPRCAQPVVAGLDNPVAASSVTVQPWEIDPAGEALALLLGLNTHHLLHTRNGGRSAAAASTPSDRTRDGFRCSSTTTARSKSRRARRRCCRRAPPGRTPTNQTF